MFVLKIFRASGVLKSSTAVLFPPGVREKVAGAAAGAAVPVPVGAGAGAAVPVPVGPGAGAAVPPSPDMAVVRACRRCRALRAAARVVTLGVLSSEEILSYYLALCAEEACGILVNSCCSESSKG